MEFVERAGLRVYTGPMFCGKTDMLIMELQNYGRAKIPYIAFKPDFDTRTEDISTRSGRGGVPAIIIPKQYPERILDYVNGTEVIGIDEVHFFDPLLAEVAHELTRRGKHVIATGLDRNFRDEAFETTAKLLAFANEVKKLTAVCRVIDGCYIRATHTQRYNPLTGEPAPYDDPVELVEQEFIVNGQQPTVITPIEFKYRAACDDHFTVPGKPLLEDRIRAHRGLLEVVQ